MTEQGELRNQAGAEEQRAKLAIRLEKSFGKR